MPTNSEETKKNWDTKYQQRAIEDLPWEEGRPGDALIELVESGILEKGSSLDAGCGSGTNAIYLASQGYTSHGIDISPTIIDYAHSRASQEGASCVFTEGDVLKLPYPNASFVLVVDYGCFNFIAPQDRETYIRGIQFVLKAGGKFLLDCFSIIDHQREGPPYSFTPDDIKGHFDGLFEILHIKENPRDLHGRKRHFLSALMQTF